MFSVNSLKQLNVIAIFHWGMFLNVSNTWLANKIATQFVQKSMDITHLKLDTSGEPLQKTPAACCTANYPAMTLMANVWSLYTKMQRW